MRHKYWEGKMLANCKKEYDQMVMFPRCVTVSSCFARQLDARAPPRGNTASRVSLARGIDYASQLGTSSIDVFTPVLLQRNVD